MFFRKKSVYDMMIVGLGNPGKSYENTRHNVGFRAVDLLAKELNADILKLKHKALYGEAKAGDKRLLLVKPQTFMNLSGEAVAPLAKFYGLEPQNILVIFDDIALPLGKIRIRRSGSDGGHNGLKSLQLYLGQEYPRVKIGVGEKPHPEYDLAKWVLSKFTDSEEKTLQPALEKAVQAALSVADKGCEQSMGQFN